MQLAANTTWFNFSIQNMSNAPAFSVYSFSGREDISQPYEFSIELVNTSSTIDLPSLLGQQGLLSIADRSGATRLVHGYVRQIEQLHTATRFTHYRLDLVPRFWLLRHTRDHRIFQNKNVIEIIETILKEQIFTGDSFSFKCFYKYEPREYCVQYGETDLHFISRLCEEEGIYFYFEHSKDKHCICFSDMPGGPRIQGESELRYFAGSGQVSDTAVINRLRVLHRINTDAVEYREWNFETPKLELTAKKEGYPAAPVPGGLDLENYQYPHLYQQRGPGNRYADIQLMRQRVPMQGIEGSADVARLLPGFTFTLNGHPRSDVNAGWWVTSMYQSGSQPQVLEQEAPDRGMSYQSSFKAIPEDIRFVPELLHAKQRIQGQQTALVTGPASEEIYVDQYGRVKVQFFWDREGQGNENTSCWIRVSQGWAGGEYGGMAIPRIGHEVLVNFLEGDPDRPIITGRVYHALNMPPYSLPEHKTRMTIKSKTHKGDGYNELRFEDMKGNEQVFLHGERDLDVLIENDRREWIKNDRHLLVGRDRLEEVTGLSSSQVNKDRMEATGEKRTVTVGGDDAYQVGGSHHLKVSGNVFLEGMTSGVVEMHEDITIKAPGGFIRIDGSGITIQGKVVNINTGGTEGTGFPVQAIPARTAALADSRDAKSGMAGTAVRKQALPPPPPAAPAKEDSFSNISGQEFVANSVPPENMASLSGKAAPVLAAATVLMRQAPLDAEVLKLSEEPFAQEWRKTVLAAKQEETTADKLETAHRFVQKNVAVTPEIGGAEAQSPAAILEAGKGTSTEVAVAKYQLLRETGVPADQMRILVGEQQTFLAVQNGPQTLVAGTDFVPTVLSRSTAALPADFSPIAGFDAKSMFTYAAVGGGV